MAERGGMGATLRSLVGSTALALSIACHAMPGAAQDRVDPRSQPTLFQADTLTYDRVNRVITAEGEVELSQGDRVLRADRIAYDQPGGRVTAEGDVALLEADGTVVFADRVDLDDTFSDGLIESLRLLFADGQSRLAAARGVRMDANRTELDRAVYSPCRVCADNPDPLWQLKAIKVTHDEEAKTVEYEDAFLEFFGIPVLYTPYFRHADPTVTRQSGFLLPRAGSSGRYGFWTQVPYFWAIAPDKDATITPFYTEDDGLILLGEYRQAFASGDLEIRGSGAYQKKRNSDNVQVGDEEFRSHIDAEGAFDIDDQWRWGFNVRQTSDDTFLRRFGILGDDFLESTGYVEATWDRSYVAADAFYWQGLLEDDDQGKTPFVPGRLRYDFISEPDRLGATWDIDASFTPVLTGEAESSYRTSGNLKWRLPHIGPSGDVTVLQAGIRGDGYWVNDVIQGDEGTFDGFTGRVVPYAALDWRYPFQRAYGTVQHVIEPFFQAYAAPNGGNPTEIPNTDSLSLDFDDANLLSLQRFPGLDRTEEGSRISYGLKSSFHGQNGGFGEIMVGQTYRFTEENEVYPTNSGLEEQTSDFVGRMIFRPHEFIDVYHRFRLDGEALDFQRNETDVTVGPRWLKASVGYVNLKADTEGSGLGEREQINSSLSLQVTDFWSASVNHEYDLRDDGGNLFWGGALNYLDECFGITVFVNREFTRDRDIEPSTNFGFRLRLLTLGS